MCKKSSKQHSNLESFNSIIVELPNDIKCTLALLVIFQRFQFLLQAIIVELFKKIRVKQWYGSFFF